MEKLTKKPGAEYHEEYQRLRTFYTSNRKVDELTPAEIKHLWARGKNRQMGGDSNRHRWQCVLNRKNMKPGIDGREPESNPLPQR